MISRCCPAFARYFDLATRLLITFAVRLVGRMTVCLRTSSMQTQRRWQLMYDQKMPSRYVEFLTFPRQSAEGAPKRYIDLLAIINFYVCLQAAWEGMALVFQFAWLNGGPAALV